MIQFDNAVVETTLIPLYMRARESRRDDAILRDPMAERIISGIDYDFTKLNKAPLSYVGCVVRGRYYDGRTQKFINEHRTPIVVNIGCGLDTRYQRIADKRNAVFYELDLPELMEIRRKLIPEEGSDRYLTGSLLETDWLDMLHSKHPDGDFLFIAEGVLMYFTEEQVKTLLKAITDRFSAGEVRSDDGQARGAPRFHEGIPGADTLRNRGWARGGALGAAPPAHRAAALYGFLPSSLGLHRANAWAHS